MPLAITGVPNGSDSEAGRINFPGDVDPINIFLRGGELYEFRANGAGSLDPILELRTATGGPVPQGADPDNTGDRPPNARDDDSGPGLNSLFRFRPRTCANYRLEVSGFGNSTGNYTVSAREVPGNTSTYNSIPAPTFVGQTRSETGDLHANGDRDFHRINLVAGRSYRFNLNGRSFGCGALRDPFLELRNNAGAIVTQNDDGGPGLNSQLTFTPAASGTFFANARAFLNAGTGGYQLAVTRVA